MHYKDLPVRKTCSAASRETGSREIQKLREENALLRREIRIAREASEITAELVVKQFEETERVLRRFQLANAQRKAVLDSATQIAIIATDQQGTIIVFNTGAENLLGYKAETIIGRHTPMIFHLKSELDRFGAELSQEAGYHVEGLNTFFECARQGRREQIEWTCVHKNGTHFPVSMSINALRDPEGDVSGFLCIAMDISEKKRSERALRESERNYRLLINNIPNIVFRGYADGSIDFFDDKIEELTGYSREEFLSRKRNWLDLIVEEDTAAARARFIDALKKDKSYIREYRIRKKNGDILWLEAGSQIICDKNGNIEFITGAFLDITERKRAEKALHESEEKYRSLFNAGPNPIFVLDMDTKRILDANPNAEETYGYSREELIGRPFEDLGTFESGGQRTVSEKVRHFKKDGTPFYVNVGTCSARYRDRDALILAVTDVTEMMEKDAQLIHAGKMTSLGEMSTGIAHELNQPLTAIKLGNLFLKSAAESGKTISPEKLMQVAREISGQVDRASEIINRLRAFGKKPDSAQDALEDVNVNVPVKTVLSIVGQQLSLQNIRVISDLDGSLPLIRAHNNRLEQVFFNLISNARDAINQKSSVDNTAPRVISIRSFCEKDRVSVSVFDTGAGIPSEIRDKLFEPFFTTKEVGKGIGLGLSISYGIVKSFGGEIHVTSGGSGTIFKVSFPCIQTETLKG